MAQKRDKEGSLGQKVMAVLYQAFCAIAEAVLRVLWTPIEKFLNFLGEQWSKAMQIGSVPGEHAFLKMGMPREFSDIASQDINKCAGWTRFLLWSFYAVAMGTEYVKAVVGIAGTRARQFMLNQLRPYYIRPEEAVAGYFRDNVTHERMFEMGAYAGFAAGEMKVKESISRPLLDSRDLQDLYLRGEIGEGFFKTYLGWHGYRPQDQEYLRALAYYIPPVPDIVRMAVREAFTPEIAQKYGQYEDFPPDFIAYAGKKGLSPEWAKRYWAAHWDLPSLSAGYEMLHRGVISPGDLHMLLRAQDVMPYWRDKLIAVSYHPYTRVDVRRMYDCGVLDAAAVKRSYLDLGYDSEKAENMTKFTIAWSTSDERDLTKADILDGYKRKLISEAEAIDLLLGMGYAPQEARFYVAREEQKAIKAKRKQVLANVKKRFEKGTISEAEATSRLLEEGFTRAEIEEQIDLWIITRGEEVYTPTVGDLKAFLKGRVITEDEFTKEMVAKGCSQKYISWYIASLRREAA